MDPLVYYTKQSPITDPGKYAKLFCNLPNDIEGLCRVVQGLIIHYLDGEKLFDYTIPDDRLPEVDICYLEVMLARILQLDDRPLTEPRPPEKRLVGCCRDFATMLCAMARHKNIPARTRVGFGAYFDPGFYVDHEIVEYWDVRNKCWRLVDPEMSELHIRVYKIPFDTRNVPRDQFIVGGLAWCLCRTGEADPDRFGHGSDSDIKGWWFIRHRLIHDLAALNKMELLLWNAWGLMEREPTEEEIALLDKVALLTQAGNEVFPQVRKIYENETRLKVPAVVTKYSPVAAPNQMKLAI